jgi:hypothetical protein
MCLTSADEIFNPPKAGVGTGWKIFGYKDDIDPTLKTTRLYGFNQCWIEYDRNGWFVDQHDETLLVYDTHSPYSTGYHIFASKSDAESMLNHATALRARDIEHGYAHESSLKYALLEVEYDDVVAIGHQTARHLILCNDDRMLAVVVARKMKICQEEGI